MRRFLAAVWDFFVGDDWRLAAGVAVALGASALVAHATSIAAWWITPVVVLATLVVSLRHAARR